MLSHHARGGKQCLISDLADAPRFTGYYDPAFAMAEVTYSRLCHLLDLPCVQSSYGYNMHSFSDSIEFPKYVSVSEYNPEWMALTEKGAKEISESDTQWKLHFGLSLLLLVMYWNKRIAGYYDNDGSFIKANNGHMFYPRELRDLFNGVKSETPINPISVTAFLKHAKWTPEITNILSRVALLSNDDIDFCVNMPEDWDLASIGQMFMKNRLRLAISTAQRILDAVSDDDLRIFEDL
jgi:hypothetical protein